MKRRTVLGAALAAVFSPAASAMPVAATVEPLSLGEYQWVSISPDPRGGVRYRVAQDVDGRPGAWREVPSP